MATIVRRVSSNGEVSFLVRVRLLGEKPRNRTFKRKTDAKAWAADVESRLGRGAFVPTGADRHRTLADLIDAYLAEPDRERKQSAMLSWWREQAGYITLDKLNPAAIAEARAELAKRTTRKGDPISGPTTNRYLAALSAACKWAWKERHWLPANPVLSVAKRPENDGIGRALSDDERERLLTTCRADPDPNIYTAVILALATGCRYSNIRFLQWEDVDLENWTFRLATTKNGEPRVVPIVGDAQVALQAHRDADPSDTGWVFKGWKNDAPASLDSAWRRVRDSAGLSGFRFHDLRHTAGTYLAEAGVSAPEIADALGHKTLAMAFRYSKHIADEHRREVLERGMRIGRKAK